MRTRTAWSARAGCITTLSPSSVTGVWQALGENVGVGLDANQLHDEFMASSGHRANILGDYNYVGIGTAVDESGLADLGNGDLHAGRTGPSTGGGETTTTTSAPVYSPTTTTTTVVVPTTTTPQSPSVATTGNAAPTKSPSDILTINYPIGALRASVGEPGTGVIAI